VPQKPLALVSAELRERNLSATPHDAASASPLQRLSNEVMIGTFLKE